MKLKHFVGLLEEERRKIEAFKRELPLCMVLVNHVIDELKLEVEQCQRSYCVIENKDKEEQEELKMERDSIMDKMDWMSSAQLWNDSCSDESVNFEKDSHEKKNGHVMSLESKSGSASAGAFVELNVILTRNEEKNQSMPLPDLAPAISVQPAPTVAGASNNRVSESAPSTSAGSTYLVLQTQRKERRSWSPELHRRFVLALQQLGGAQAAMPKQIRELMMVDGLTNDEVKSHLQKYRLHSRRRPNSSASEVNRPAFMAAAQTLSPAGGDGCDGNGKSEVLAGNDYSSSYFV